MKKKIQKAISILLVTLVLTTCVPTIPVFNNVLTVEAHSGRTDSRGGHHDNKNKSGLGSYHYHCGGHPAHLHPNGVCPYAGSSTTASSNKETQKTTVQDPDATLRTKYKSITDDFNNKKNTGYFRDDVQVLIKQFLAGDSDAVETFILSLMTSDEKTDLFPLNTQAKRDIYGGLMYMRLYDAFLSQVVAQEQAQAALQAQVPVPTPQEENVSQDDLLYKLVSQTQVALNALGFYTGAIDGVFGVETQQALISFQTAYGLTIDGTINEQVVAALGLQF